MYIQLICNYISSVELNYCCVCVFPTIYIYIQVGRRYPPKFIWLLRLATIGIIPSHTLSVTECAKTPMQLLLDTEMLTGMSATLYVDQIMMYLSSILYSGDCVVPFAGDWWYRPAFL